MKPSFYHRETLPQEPASFEQKRSLSALQRKMLLSCIMGNVGASVVSLKCNKKIARIHLYQRWKLILVEPFRVFKFLLIVNPQIYGKSLCAKSSTLCLTQQKFTHRSSASHQFFTYFFITHLHLSFPLKPKTIFLLTTSSPFSCLLPFFSCQTWLH